MSYELQDQFSLSVYFNGKAFPFDEAGTLNYLHIVSSVKLAFPILTISLTDGKSWFTDNSVLRDGAQIKVELSVGPTSSSPLRIYTFRQSAYKEEATGSGTNFTIEGYINSPRYFVDCIRTPVTGTSDHVLSLIARACQLEYRGVGTQDSQVWYPANRPFYQFARDISMHGFANDNSCMALGVDASGLMMYRDITAMDHPTSTLSYLDVLPGAYTVTGFNPTSKSGASNQASGYSSTTVEQRAFSADEETGYVAQRSVGAVLNEEGTLAIGDTKASLKGGRVQHSSVDVGNNHPNYTRAYHQNQRVRGMFSSSVDVSTPNSTPIRVLDTVQLKMNKASTEKEHLANYAGLYRVLAKVIYLVPGQYTEKISLARRTLPIPNDAPPVQSIIDTSQSQRTEVLEPAVSSVANTPQQSDAAASSAASSMGASGLASVEAATAASSAPMSSLKSTLDNETLIALVAAVIAYIQGLAATGVLEITGYPLGDPLRASRASEYKITIDAYIADQQDELISAAKKADADASVGASIATKMKSQLSSIMSTATRGAEQSMKALSSIFASVSDVTASNTAELSRASSSASSALVDSTSATTASASFLQDLAASYPTDLSSARDLCFTQIDDAVIAP